MIVPDSITPFTGWRVWRVTPGHGYDLELRSLYNDDAWPVQQAAVMHCDRRGATPCPPDECDERHQCGIHASKEQEGALRYLPERLRARRFEPVPVLQGTRLVFGLVHLWGEVEETTLSFRGQYAYPASIFMPVSFRLEGWTAVEAAATLEDAYGVQVSLVRYATDQVAA